MGKLRFSSGGNLAPESTFRQAYGATGRRRPRGVCSTAQTEYQ
jgi:hypothetical protein